MLRSRFDLSGLHALLGQLEALASPGFRRDLQQRLVAAALLEVERGFVESRAPAGQPWAPLRSRVGRPLYRTGRLARSFGAEPAGQGFLIGSPLAWASFHQQGTATLPARPMLPTDGLGPIWTRALERELDEAVGQVMGGGR